MLSFQDVGFPKKTSALHIGHDGKWLVAGLKKIPNMKGWLYPYNPAYVQLRTQKKVPTRCENVSHKKGLVVIFDDTFDSAAILTTPVWPR